jgi:hypothetical protein
MQLFCPACQAAFASVSRCPRCGGLLLMPQETAALAPPPPVGVSEVGGGRVQPTPLGRVAVGTALALGAYLGLRKVLLAAVSATIPDAAEWWLSFDGLMTVFGAQFAAVLFGAVVAGAGRAKPLAVGGAIGAVCGGLFLAGEVLAGTPPEQLVLYLQPLVLTVAGGLGGLIGARVWPALPELDIRPPVPTGSKLSSMRLVIEEVQEPSRPTAWFAILVGAVIMVAGVALADTARHKVQAASGGLLKVASISQGQFISWQLATLVVVLGGVAAGAGTGAGAWHGLLAGVLGGAGAIGFATFHGGMTPPMDYWLTRLALTGPHTAQWAPGVAVASGIAFAGVIGGWLGGQVFLPLPPPHRRGRRLRYGD